MKYIFETRMEVRDYECDIEGIVNNANYLHYAEHTRHLFLRSLGVSFAALHEQGIDAVVHSMKLQYKVPLRCDDEFISRLNLKKDGLKYLFYPDQRSSWQQPRIRRSLQRLHLIFKGFIRISKGKDPQSLLALAVAIDVGKRTALVVEDFFWTEETGYLDGCILYGVRGMDDVLLVAYGIVTTDGAWGSLATVGNASHRANHLNSLNARDSHRYDGRSLHGGTKAREERFIHKVSIVLTQNLIT